MTTVPATLSCSPRSSRSQISAGMASTSRIVRASAGSEPGQSAAEADDPQADDAVADGEADRADQDQVLHREDHQRLEAAPSHRR